MQCERRMRNQATGIWLLEGAKIDLFSLFFFIFEHFPGWFGHILHDFVFRRRESATNDQAQEINVKLLARLLLNVPEARRAGFLSSGITPNCLRMPSLVSHFPHLHGQGRFSEPRITSARSMTIPQYWARIVRMYFANRESTLSSASAYLSSEWWKYTAGSWSGRPLAIPGVSQ